MHKKIKRKWLEAMRGGRFVFGDQVLFDGDCHCPLGVLCEVFREEKLAAGESAPEWQKAEGHLTLDGEMSKLPAKVMNWAGLKTPWPTVRTPEGEAVELTELLGRRKFTMAEVADLVEATPASIIGVGV